MAVASGCGSVARGAHRLGVMGVLCALTVCDSSSSQSIHFSEGVSQTRSSVTLRRLLHWCIETHSARERNCCFRVATRSSTRNFHPHSKSPETERPRRWHSKNEVLANTTRGSDSYRAILSRRSLSVQLIYFTITTYTPARRAVVLAQPYTRFNALKLAARCRYILSMLRTCTSPSSSRFLDNLVIFRWPNTI